MLAVILRRTTVVLRSCPPLAQQLYRCGIIERRTGRDALELRTKYWGRVLLFNGVSE